MSNVAIVLSEGSLLFLAFLLSETKNPRQSEISVKDELISPRCHLDFAVIGALCGIPTYPRQLTYALRYSLLGITFQCTLSGPFDSSFLARLSAMRALCRGLNCRYLRFNGLTY